MVLPCRRYSINVLKLRIKARVNVHFRFNLRQVNLPELDFLTVKNGILIIIEILIILRLIQLLEKQIIYASRQPNKRPIAVNANMMVLLVTIRTRTRSPG